MKKFTLCALLLLLLLTSCAPATKPLTYDEIREKFPDAVSEAETTDPAAEEAAKQRQADGEAVAAILSENSDIVSSVNLFGTAKSAVCDGHIYVLINQIRRLSSVTGYLQSPCMDPLCDHESCIESLDVESLTSDGEKLYFKGGRVSASDLSIKEWDNISFVASYDPRADQFEFLDVWERERGSISYFTALFDGYLYYTKKINDDTNSLFRIPTDGGNPERLTFKDEFVLSASVSGDRIYYITQARTLKSMAHDGSDVQVLDEYIGLVYADGDSFYKVSIKDENGFAAFRNGEPLPDRVFSIPGTHLLDGALWYTIHDEKNLGTYTDQRGRKQDRISYMGTAVYRYDPASGERTEYDCTFAYGVSKVLGRVGKYIVISAGELDTSFGYWMFNTEDPGEYYKLHKN